MSVILIIGCLIGLLLLGIVFSVGIVLFMQAGERDVVSTAREEWIQRRSEKDREE